MTDKILFWIDAGLMHFGIAKFIQNKIDAKLFSIYDLNHHLKKSFKNQKLVNFTKSWFFWDYINKKNMKKPDLKYLSEFEKKYDINLWKLAYSERVFSNYNPFHNFTEDEILSTLEQECKFFENILDEINPNFLIIKVTDFHRNHLLAKLCKSKGVKVLMLIPTRFGYRSSISTDLNEFDETWDLSKNLNFESFNSFESIEKYFTNYDRFKQTSDQKSGGTEKSIFSKMMPVINWLSKTYDKEYLETYDHFGITRSRAIKYGIISLIQFKYRKLFIDKNFLELLPEDQKFVYFPLHVQPERNIDLDSPFYSNQIEVISKIAKSLPINFKLFVKEHPNMKFRNWRKISDYKKINQIPNVELIHPSVKPDDIIKKCELAITIAGNAGLEAAFYQKPAIILADLIYSSIPSVFRLKNIDDLPDTIRKALKTKVSLADLNEYSGIIEKNSFHFDEVKMDNEIMEIFHPAGFITNDNISMQKFDEFLDKENSSFEILANEHIKKIEHYKKLQYS
jgi:hypothetical protein